MLCSLVQVACIDALQEDRQDSVLYFHEDECQEVVGKPGEEAKRFREMHKELFFDLSFGEMPVLLTQSSTRMVVLTDGPLVSGTSFPASPHSCSILLTNLSTARDVEVKAANVLHMILCSSSEMLIAHCHYPCSPAYVATLATLGLLPDSS